MAQDYRNREDETPSSKAGSMHPNNDSLGSQRSLDQELLLAILTKLQSISQRQDTLQNQMDVNVTRMANIERKLDLVLEMHESFSVQGPERNQSLT